MLFPYQENYIEHVKEIAVLDDFFHGASEGFDAWYHTQEQAAARIAALREENLALLEQHLFPTLDDLHNASAETIASLESFAGVLMDWRTNLDCGIYVLIHDALLSMYRVRQDQKGIIKELYLLGMGLYYQNQMMRGMGTPKRESFFYRNELVFTEAGSYLKYFEVLEGEETKGYVIRSLANIAICVHNKHQKVAVSARILQIVQDPWYRNLAPGLPWDAYLRKTHQQMSANRDVVGAGDLSKDELAAILDSCEVVFGSEKSNPNPNIRWLWPYYEMEYSCGFVDLATTLNRMEGLIRSMPYDQYDESGLYANVQLPIYYGRLLERNPELPDFNLRSGFLAEAYRKMMHSLLTWPNSHFDGFFFYDVCLVFSGYFETPGVESYREVTTQLMKKLAGRLYIDSLLCGKLLAILCRNVFATHPDFFDDIPFLQEIHDPIEKETALLEYASQCGLYHDFGLLKMNIQHLTMVRRLLEEEYQIYQLHTISAWEDLSHRASTERFADIALGHHSWYNGAGGYPTDYVRNRSPYRQMTDAAALVVALMEEYDTSQEKDNLTDIYNHLIAQEHRRFSPVLTACLADPALQQELTEALNDTQSLYATAWDNLAPTP